MARERDAEGGPVRRHGHGDSLETATGAGEMAASDLRVSDLAIPKLHGALEEKEKEGAGVSMEDAFLQQEIPRSQDQLTVRGLVVAFVLGLLFCIITHKLNLTVGVIPSLNISAGLLGFFLIRLWTLVSSKLGFFVKPFTRQENTVIQTCVVSCYGLAFSGTNTSTYQTISFALGTHSNRSCKGIMQLTVVVGMSGGFGSYLLGMDQASHDRVNTAETGDIPGNEGVKNPGLGWMIGFTFLVSFVGIFSIVLLRKVWFRKT